MEKVPELLEAPAWGQRGLRGEFGSCPAAGFCWQELLCEGGNQMGRTGGNWMGRMGRTDENQMGRMGRRGGNQMGRTDGNQMGRTGGNQMGRMLLSWKGCEAEDAFLALWVCLALFYLNWEQWSRAGEFPAQGCSVALT